MRTFDLKTLMPALALVSGLALQIHTAAAGNSSELPHAFDAGWKGQKTCELLFEDDTVRVGRCVFPPGIGHEKHYHNVDSNGEREITTQAGGDWSTTAVTIHEAMNIGETTTSYLIVEPKGQ